MATSESPVTVAAATATTVTTAAAAAAVAAAACHESKVKSCVFMFMFRCRRNALVKRLWRAARVMEQLQQQQQQQQQQEMEQQQVHKKQLQWKAATHALFKRFSEQQLHALVAAIESAGAAATPCVVLDADHVASKKFFSSSLNILISLLQLLF